MTAELQQKPNPVRDIRQYLETDAVKDQMAKVLPSHLTADRVARVALTAITKTPKLLDCTRESLLRCLMDCSSLGLEPNGRDAHLIPHNNTKAGTVECTLIVDWKGLVSLARRSGSVSLFRAELVQENDEFGWENGRVSHSIDFRKERGKPFAVYSYVKFADGAEDWEVLTIDEVDGIRRRSRAGNSGPWVTDFAEMAKKTAIRRHSKRLTLSPEFADALEKDDDRYEERDVTPRAAARARAIPLDPTRPALPEPPPPPPEKRPEALPADAQEWDDREGGAE